jgi:hypothetical protein
MPALVLKSGSIVTGYTVTASPLLWDVLCHFGFTNAPCTTVVCTLSLGMGIGRSTRTSRLTPRT